MRVNSPMLGSAAGGGGADAGSGLSALEFIRFMNSSGCGFGAGSGQSPATGRFGSGELNMRVNSPGPDAAGDLGDAGGGGSGGSSGSPIGFGGAA